MKELKMTYKEGKGRISIDLDRFFPCTQKDFRKMLDIVDISAEKEDCINVIYGYLVGKIDFIKSIINHSDNPQNEFCDCPDTYDILKDPNGHGKKYAGYADILCKRYDLQPIDTDFVVKLKKTTFYTRLYIKSKEKYDFVKKDGWTFSKFGYNFEVYKDTYRYVILVGDTGVQIAESDKKKDIPFSITEKTLKLLETKKELIENFKKEYLEKMIELGEVEAPKEEKEYFVESPDFYETKETENVQEEEIKRIINAPAETSAEPKKNRIPRNVARLYITYLVGSITRNIGDTAVVKRNEFGDWIATDKNGKQWNMFISHLRNGNLIQIDRIETHEDIERQKQAASQRHEMARREYIIQALTQPQRKTAGWQKITVKPQTTTQATTHRMPPGVLTGKPWISENQIIMPTSAKRYHKKNMCLP